MSLCIAASIPVLFAFHVSSLSQGTSCNGGSASPALSLLLVWCSSLNTYLYIRVVNRIENLLVNQTRITNMHNMNDLFVVIGVCVDRA